ncbi:DUF2637 domain-containing protein [Nocardiopsis alba]
METTKAGIRVDSGLREDLDHTKEVIVMEFSRWSRVMTIDAVLMLAGIAAVVSYSHMYELALRHGEPEWRAALFPLLADGMIVGASMMTLLSDARYGRRGGLLPWRYSSSARSPRRRPTSRSPTPRCDRRSFTPCRRSC